MPETIQNYKVYTIDGQMVVHVPTGQGEAIRAHLLSHGIDSLVSELEAPFDRVQIESDVSEQTVQVILDNWR